MEVIFEASALEDLQYWKDTNNEAVLRKIRQLLENIIQTPFEGIGKPESLKHLFSGAWPRRINSEHGLVYKVEESFIRVF
ncbi:MAG: Txe/YoeB family addiction module toxin [Chitinophagaceae bacterium]